MNRQSRRGIRLADYVETIKGTWPLNLLSLGLAIAAGVGAAELLSVDERQAVITGALIFIALQLLVLYNAVGLTLEQVDVIASGTGICRVVVGPAHARLRQSSSGRWDSDGVVWLALSCDPGSKATITMEVPSGATIRWKAQGTTRSHWKYVGDDGQGQTTWTTEVTHAEGVTPLGQFAVSTAVYLDNRHISVRALGKTVTGLAIEDRVEIGLLPDVPEDEPMQPVPASTQPGDQ